MTAKFVFIAAEKADVTSPYPVTKMCAWLKVSTSGFYDHQNAVESDRARRRAKLTQHVQATFDLGRGTYGVRRVHQVLRRSHDPEVASVSTKLVRSIMAELGPESLPAAGLQDHHPARPRRDRPAGRSGGSGLHRRAARDEAGRRHHLHPHLGRLAVPGHGDRLLHPRSRRLVDGRSYADQPDLRRHHHGRRPREFATRRDIPQRPRRSIHQRRIPCSSRRFSTCAARWARSGNAGTTPWPNHSLPR